MENVAPDTVKTAADWLLLIGMGLLIGALGQVARTVIGLKKLNDAAEESNRKFEEVFSASRLLVSLLIGAVAGALAAVALNPDLNAMSATAVMGLAAAGYSGADFIEGFMDRYLPKTPVPPEQAPAANIKVETPSPTVVNVAAPAVAADDALG